VPFDETSSISTQKDTLLPPPDENANSVIVHIPAMTAVVVSMPGWDTKLAIVIGVVFTLFVIMRV
jgi:hypothetical protein